MLSQEIMSVHAAMGCLLPRVDPESAEMVRLCRRNLEASADTAETLEQALIAPEGDAPTPVRESRVASMDADMCKMDRPPLAHERQGGRA